MFIDAFQVSFKSSVYLVNTVKKLQKTNIKHNHNFCYILTSYSIHFNTQIHRNLLGITIKSLHNFGLGGYVQDRKNYHTSHITLGANLHKIYISRIYTLWPI